MLGRPEDEVETLFSGGRSLAARVNSLSPEPHEEVFAELRRLGGKELGWCREALLLSRPVVETVSTSQMYVNGAIYLQNPASLLPVLALEPEQGMVILDVCAAPGGKATHIASRTSNSAELWLNDLNRGRSRRMQRVMAWQHAHYRSVTCYPGQYIDRSLSPVFDRVLLDAQCSGEGRIDLGRPKAMQYWSLNRVRRYSRLQQRMLVSSFRLLKPGGILVYSTCTLSPEENEAPVDHLVRHFGAEVEEIDVPDKLRAPRVQCWSGRRFHPTLAHAVRVAPGGHFEPFFVCRLRKPSKARVPLLVPA